MDGWREGGREGGREGVQEGKVGIDGDREIGGVRVGGGLWRPA
jgi:hypothetical protein